MILGLGSDLCDIRRIESALERHGPRFTERLFTEVERAYADAKPPRTRAGTYAKRFAAKEAASKAFGTGIGAELSLTSIGVLNGPEGEPVIELDDKARALLAARGASRLLISLTHTDTLAQAFAVLVR